MLKKLTLCAWTLVLAGSFSAPAASARMEDWKDTQGGSFRGEPVEALGPIALFRPSTRGARMVPFHLLTPDDCVRFYQQAKDTPPRSDDWAQVKSKGLSSEIRRYAQQVKNDRLVPAELTGRREPAFFIAIFGTNGDAKGWEIIDAVLPLYTKLQEAFPGEAEAIFFGLDHTVSEHRNMAVSKRMPWLVADLEQEINMTNLRRYAPGEKIGVIVFSRTGVPLFSSDVSDFGRIAKPVVDLMVLLDTIQPDNPKGWKDRAHYLKAIQPAAFANSHSDPVLMGNPLKADGLRQRKVYRIEAAIKVAADGSITDVTLQPDEQNLPAAMSAPLAEALKKAGVFVPAVDHGKFVDGVYSYRFEIGR